MTKSTRNIAPDIWLWILKILVILSYVSLKFIKPSGEGWGYGWNLIAYWVYLAPSVLIFGGLHIWRQRAIALKSKPVDSIVLVAAFIFPLVSFIVLKLKV